MVIEIRGVTKKFGKLVAVDDMTLDVGAGEVFGFIGPNGAGKSTTMKILACLLRPDSGSAKVNGHDVMTDGDAIRRVLGYMPDVLGVYDDLTVESLSRGMKQRLGVARVLVHDPKVLLLDEPASGLDPRARIEMRELLTELGRMGKCLIVSSHILTELAQMCSSIGIIERGRLLYAGSIDDAYRRMGVGDRVRIRLESEDAPLEALRKAIANDERTQTAKVADGAIHVELTPGQSSHHFLIELLVAKGQRIAAFTPEAPRLEDAFMTLTKGQVQ